MTELNKAFLDYISKMPPPELNFNYLWAEMAKAFPLPPPRKVTAWDRISYRWFLLRESIARVIFPEGNWDDD